MENTVSNLISQYLSPIKVNQYSETLKSDFMSLLPKQGLVKVSGTDNEKFLQGQFTCDLRELTEENSILGCYCNLQGRAIALFRCSKNHQDIWLQMPKSIIPIFIEQLKKYAVFSKVTVENISDQFIQSGIYFSKPSEQLQQFGKVIVVGENRFEIVSNIEQTQKLLQQNISLAPDNFWHLQNLLQGITQLYPVSQQHFIPLYLNYHHLGAISWKKGCYLGQEVLARMFYKAKLKQHLYPVYLPSNHQYQATDVITDQSNNIVGEIVDYEYYDDKIFAWVLVKDESVSQLHINQTPIKIASEWIKDDRAHHES